MDMMGAGMAVVVIFWVILGRGLLALASTALILDGQGATPAGPGPAGATITADR